jgi:hypothetical protein
MADCQQPGGYFVKTGTFRGYPAKIRVNGMGRIVTISRSASEPNIYVTALDRGNDGRFDELRLNHVPKGDPLEGFANFQTLEDAYKEVSATGQKD